MIPIQSIFVYYLHLNYEFSMIQSIRKLWLVQFSQSYTRISIPPLIINGIFFAAHWLWHCYKWSTMFTIHWCDFVCISDFSPSIVQDHLLFIFFSEKKNNQILPKECLSQFQVEFFLKINMPPPFEIAMWF